MINETKRFYKILLTFELVRFAYWFETVVVVSMYYFVALKLFFLIAFITLVIISVLGNRTMS